MALYPGVDEISQDVTARCILLKYARKSFFKKLERGSMWKFILGIFQLYQRAELNVVAHISQRGKDGG